MKPHRLPGIPDWLTYVAVATGVVGAITGATGAITGVVSYRRVSKMKALDLRLELRRLVADTLADLRDLPTLIDSANDSRFAIAAPTGRLGSGAMDAWKEQVAADRALARSLQTGFPFSDTDTFKKLSVDQLEAKLAELHSQRQQIDRLIQKYRASMATDDLDRERYQADMRARHLRND